MTFRARDIPADAVSSPAKPLYVALNLQRARMKEKNASTKTQGQQKEIHNRCKPTTGA